MENSDNHTENTNNFNGWSQVDQQHEIMWRKWFECCFDKNGRYIEENEKVFNEFMERQEQKSQANLTSSASNKNKDSELSL